MKNLRAPISFLLAVIGAVLWMLLFGQIENKFGANDGAVLGWWGLLGILTSPFIGSIVYSKVSKLLIPNIAERPTHLEKTVGLHWLVIVIILGYLLFKFIILK